MYKFSRKYLPLSLLITGLIYLSALYASPETNSSKSNAVFVTQGDLKWKPLPKMPEGAQIAMIRGDLSKPERYTFLLKLPDGYLIPPHWHSNDEETTVISGTLNVGMGDKVDKVNEKVMTPGSFALIPGHDHHYVRATGETIFQDEGMGPRDTIFVNPAELEALMKKNK